MELRPVAGCLHRLTRLPIPEVARLALEAVVRAVDDAIFDYATANRVGMRGHLAAEGRPTVGGERVVPSSPPAGTPVGLALRRS